MLPGHVVRAIKGELLDVVRSAGLSQESERAILAHLSGPDRVLPEGKANLVAAVTLLSYASAARNLSLEAVPAAAAMEILAATGDLIDDIQDGDIELLDGRRGIGRVVGNVSLLIMLGHHALSRLTKAGVSPARVVKAYEIVDSLLIDSLRGQAMDLELESQRDVTTEESLEVSGMKSASMVKCAAMLGACLGTDDPDDLDLYGRFGWHFGMTLQLMNDVGAVWPRTTESNSDIRLKKKTLPVVYATVGAKDGDSPEKQVIRAYSESDEPASVDESTVKWALWRSGAIHYTWMVAAREKAKAQRIARYFARKGEHGRYLETLLA
jgi:geranylgeranyl diphosphate synthase type I